MRASPALHGATIWPQPAVRHPRLPDTNWRCDTARRRHRHPVPPSPTSHPQRTPRYPSCGEASLGEQASGGRHMTPPSQQTSVLCHHRRPVHVSWSTSCKPQYGPFRLPRPGLFGAHGPATDHSVEQGAPAAGGRLLVGAPYCS